jgi:hypothetical protein
MALTPEPKTFQAKQQYLLSQRKKDGNAIAPSILLVSKIIRKRGDLTCDTL